MKALEDLDDGRKKALWNQFAQLGPIAQIALSRSD
jgi:hypothetical protein